MPYVATRRVSREERLTSAEARWSAILAARPDLEPALDLQRRLITEVVDLADAIERGRLPRLSLPPKYVAAKLSGGVPALSGEPIPLPVDVLTRPLLRLCTDLAAGGAGAASDHSRPSSDSGAIEPGSLPSASLAAAEKAIS